MKSNQGSVLVVDDDKINRDLLSRQLERQGHGVAVAENGRQALEMMRAQPFDLVLLDIMMPEMDGYQVLEQLKADASLRHIPVIVVSAVSDLESVVRCIELGAEDYLFKPFNRVLLKARVDASLEKKRLRDEEQSYLEELAIMQRIDRELNDTLDVTRAMRITLDWAMRRSDADAGLVGVIEEDGIRIVASQGYGAELASYQDAHLSVELPAIQKAIQSGQLQRLSAVGSAKDGDKLLAAAQSQVAVPIRRQQKVVGVLLLESVGAECCAAETTDFLARLSDHAAISISNAQLYTAVQAANIAKSDFVSLVAHELKTPMTSIKGHADVLLKSLVGPVNKTQAELLNIIRSNVDRMAALVVDLTDISRIEAGRLRLERDAVSITEVVEEVARSARSQIDEKEQTLLLQTTDNLPSVWGDRARLIQVLTNLVNNAYKYTPSGGQIVIRAERTANQWDPEGAPEVVHVAVQDNGIGISSEEQEKVFLKFFRSQDQQARQVPGTGLGLNIAKYLVEMQGGSIWFESELRKGTTFHFTVPVAETG
jgi:signal transduction histidine kinase/DNA-binding response OmpR family regulator